MEGDNLWHYRSPQGVDFDNAERDSIVAADMTTLTEQNGSPGGIVGFKLTYFQVSCQVSNILIFHTLLQPCHTNTYKYSNNVNTFHSANLKK